MKKSMFYPGLVTNSQSITIGARGPEKTAGVGLTVRWIASLFLDFLFLFHQGKRYIIIEKVAQLVTKAKSNRAVTRLG